MDVPKAPGKGTKLSEEAINDLAQHSLDNNFKTNKQLIQYLQTKGYPTVTSTTVSNYLKKHKISSSIAAEKPHLTETAKHNRVEASLSNLLAPLRVFRKTVFIDEFSIDSRMHRKTRVKRLKGERFAEKNIKHYELRNPKTFSFVCSFSYSGVGPIQLIDGRFTAAKYLEYLQNSLIPFYNELYVDSYYILHDNARVHTANIVKEYLELTLPDRVHIHPPYSPDLNPIENLGNELKRKLYERLGDLSFRNHGELGEITCEIWREFDNNLDLIHKLVDSVRSRYRECVNSMGSATRY